MDFIKINYNQKPIVTCLPDGGKLSSEADALDAVAACGEHDTDKLLIPGGNLSEAFFDLKTGLAGAFLLKLSNYRIQAAVICPAELIGTGRFYEFVLETNRGKDFRVYQERQKALDWLAG